jgi:hypothetical protein
MEKFILVMQCKNCSKVFSSVNKGLEHVCPEELGTQPTAHNNARVKCTLYSFNEDCRLKFGCCCGDFPCQLSYEYTSPVA